VVAIIIVCLIISAINVLWKNKTKKRNDSDNCSFLTFHYTIPIETIIPTIFIDNKPKVYCKDCKHYKFLNKYSIWRNCINPNNIKEINTPLEKETYLIKQFMTINKDNNCSWYEPKEVVKPQEQKGAKNVKDNKKRNNKN